MVSLTTVLLQNAVAFTLMCLCSTYNEDWLKHPVFSKLPEECVPQTCSDLETDQRIQGQPCDCDESCSRYETCCVDSPYAASRPLKSFGKREECSRVQGSDFAAFMVSSCNPRWRGYQVIRALCERITQSDRDPLAVIPVTNSFSKITYRNYFCSLCNFDNRGAVLWSVLLTFHDVKLNPTTEVERENILRCLEYSRDRNGWGIWNTSNDNVRLFIPIKVSAQIPPAVGSFVKRCNVMDEKNLVSRCTTGWTDERVKNICQSYLSPITVALGEGNDRRFAEFRNPHCAVCNNVSDFEEASCFKATTVSFVPSLSFTLLLDVNPSDGDKVGQTNSCGENEVHDPFFKKCRALVCALPGYIVENGRCVNA